MHACSENLHPRHTIRIIQPMCRVAWLRAWHHCPRHWLLAHRLPGITGCWVHSSVINCRLTDYLESLIAGTWFPGITDCLCIDFLESLIADSHVPDAETLFLTQVAFHNKQQWMWASAQKMNMPIIEGEIFYFWIEVLLYRFLCLEA